MMLNPAAQGSPKRDHSWAAAAAAAAARADVVGVGWLAAAAAGLLQQEEQNRRANQDKLGQLSIGLQLTRLAVDGGGAPSAAVRAQVGEVGG
jgi:hypothetical protein